MARTRKRPKKSIEMKHITLMPWGYWIRYYKGKSVVLAKMYKFKDFPTKEECLAAAQKWRDENKPPNMYSQKYKMKRDPSPNNKLGIKGVYIEERKRMNGVTSYAIGIWTDKCKTRKKHFSINKYGRDEAIRLAKEYRDREEKKVIERVRIEKLEGTYSE